MFFSTYENATSFSTLFSSFQGCNGPNLVECLRKVPVQNLINITFDLGNSSAYHPPLWPAMPWGPAIDGVTTPVMPLKALQSGNFNKVPVLLGTNHDEGSIFIPGLPQLVHGVKLPLKTQADLHTVLLHFFNNTNALKVEQQYPVSRVKDYDALMAVILRDYFFVCSNRRAAAALSSHSLPVFYYQFDYRGDLIWNTTFGDFHASELLMVFDNYQVLHYSARDIMLSGNFQDYWTNFAKSLDPKVGTESSELLKWPKYDAADETNIVLDLPLSLNKHLLSNDCNFWDQLLYPSS
jgi:carboxylesterase type B